MTKVTELIKGKEPLSYSFEITPGISEEEIDALDVDPTFFAVTWHARSHQCADMNVDALRIARSLARRQKHVLLHISCDFMTANYLIGLLGMLQENKICNLFLILGESYDPKTSEFQSTSQLIKFIKTHTGNYFCIGVAGFPDCSETKLLHLKDKIESGADFIITQAFFEANTYKTFAEQCQRLHIKVPIIPGVFPYESSTQLNDFIKLCSIKVTSDLLEYVKNKEKLNIPCLEIFKRLIGELHVECGVNHIHLFTLNQLQRVNTLIQKEELLELKYSV